MQQQPYGYSNNYDQIQTQPMYQQQPMYPQQPMYQPQQSYGNNVDNNSHPFAPPPGYQNNTRAINYQDQDSSQPYGGSYYQNSRPEDEDRPPGQNNYQQNTAIGPNNIGLGLELQNNRFEPENPNQGGFSWNGAQPDQDTSSKKKDPTPPRSLSIRQLTRKMTKWGTSDRSGTAMSIFGLCGTIVILCVLIALMVYHFKEKDIQLTSMSGGLDYMAFNLNADPIMKFSWANSCPVGTETVHLGNWPGTKDGCTCVTRGLKVGSCDGGRKDSLIFCSDVSDIDARDIYKWENAAFCVQRAKLGVDYVKESSCAQGYQECSSGFCFLEGKSCPITSIVFQSTGSPSEMLATGKYVVTSNTAGAAPVIDLDASMNDVPCFSNTEIPKDGSHGDYKLLNKRPEGCEKYGVDTLFSTKIDSKSETALFQVNNFPSDVFDLPDYRAVLDSTTTFLSGRKRIDVNYEKAECLSVKTEILSNAAYYAGKLNNYVSGTAITAMVLHAILFFLVFAAFCKSSSGNGWKETLSGTESGVWLMPYVIFTFFELIVYIVMVALVKKARSHLIEAQDYLVGLDKMGCFPVGPPKMIIADYDNVVDDVASKLNGYAVALLVLTLVSFVPVVTLLIYKYKKQ